LFGGLLFEQLGDLMPKQLRKNSIYGQAQAARICFEAKKLYGHLFEPISYKNGILKVSVPNGIVAQNVQAQSEEIIKKINQVLGSNSINKIRSIVNYRQINHSGSVI